VSAVPADEPLVALEHLEQHFPVHGGLLGRVTGHVRAVDDVTLSIAAGETVGLVGESGCGKSTLSRSLLRLLEPTGGTVRFAGRDITTAGRRELRPLRREMQMVFQDPYGSLNPRRRIGRVLEAPLRLRGVARGEAPGLAGDLLERVGLERAHAARFPHELSGGQRQRVGIARALAVEPRLVVLDEPVSALDVSVQAQIVNLLADLRDESGVAYLLVAHDLSVVRHASDRVAVMYLGKIVEVAPGDELHRRPIHPYTAALLSAIPVPDPRESRRRSRVAVGGEPPSPLYPPPGCVFHTRCPRAQEICRHEIPRLSDYGDGHTAACHVPLNVTAGEAAASTRAEASPRASGDTPPRPSG
jgi:oligopeptide/dipeptide ABC transporter ATP-binding protein